MSHEKKSLQVQTNYVDSTENEKFLRNDKAKVKLKGKSFLTILLVGSTHMSVKFISNACYKTPNCINNFYVYFRPKPSIPQVDARGFIRIVRRG